MNDTTVKLQIPLNKSLRDKIEKHARSLGFSSVQDFTRVMYSTVLENNMRLSFSDPEERLSPEAEARYMKQLERHEIDRKAGKVQSFDNPEDALRFLHNL